MQKVTNFLKKYEKVISPFFIVGGFVLDNLTLRRSDLSAENILLASYLVIVGVVIVLMNRSQNNIRLRAASNFLLFFAFGGLFSVFTVFYSRSSFILSSWPFLLLLFVAMLSADLLKKQYQRLNVQIGIFFLAIFSFLIFHLPTVTGIINQKMFLITGVVALIIIYLYILVLMTFLDKKLFSHKVDLVIFGIFVVVNLMYFFNFIPPVPLVMKDSEVGLNITKENNIYKILDQQNDREVFVGFINGREQIFLLPAQKVFFYAAIFAPIKIQTEIVHHWQFYNLEIKKWEDVADISMNLQGGRDNGYRSYSYISSVKDGKWRVFVETENGQIIGVHNFYIKIVKSLSGIKTQIKDKK